MKCPHKDIVYKPAYVMPIKLMKRAWSEGPNANLAFKLAGQTVLKMWNASAMFNRIISSVMAAFALGVRSLIKFINVNSLGFFCVLSSLSVVSLGFNEFGRGKKKMTAHEARAQAMAKYAAD